MEVKSLICQGRANAGLAAAQDTDLVRLGELTVELSGKASANHTHEAADITDLAEELASLMASRFEDSDSVGWVADALPFQAEVRLKLNGGLLADAEGVFLNSGVISIPGHAHLAGDIADFQEALRTQLAALLLNGPAVEWLSSGVGFSASVQVTGGGLVVSADGLGLDWGTGTNQVARGDHTHALLHPAVTVQPSNSLQLSIGSPQVLAAEIALRAGSGLVLNSGVGNDFGPGHNQVARGDHTHPAVGGLTVATTPSLGLSLTSGNVLSGAVAVDANPGANRGRLGIGTDGLYVELGTDAQRAAAGTHSHSAATTSADGFLSAADKAKLDGLTGAASPAEGMVLVLDGHGSAVPTGLYAYLVMPYAGTITGWDLIGLPTGTLVLDVYRGAFGSLPLTAGQSIAGSAKPTLSSGTPARAQNLAVAWSFAAGDVLGINVDACSGVTRATLGLRILRS